MVSVADPQLAQKKVKVSDLQQDVTFAAYAERNNNERLSKLGRGIIYFWKSMINITDMIFNYFHHDCK